MMIKLWEAANRSSKREVYTGTILPQVRRKISNKLSNLIAKRTRKRKINKSNLLHSK